MKNIKLFLFALLGLVLSVPLSVQAADGLITSVDQLYSPCTRENSGSHNYELANMLDRDTTTYWCPETDGDLGTKYFEVELPYECEKVYFVFTRRYSATANKITKWGVYGAPAGELATEKTSCVELAHIETPYNDVRGETLTSDVFDTKGYTHVRFYIENTTTPTQPYGSVAEFQLYEVADGDDTSITNKKIVSISDAITTQPEEGKWYLIMNNRGGTMTPAGDTGAGESITRASSADAVTEGMAAEGVAGYLLSFTPTGQTSTYGVGGVYTLQWATGNYWKSIYDVSNGVAVTTSSDASDAGAYNVYPTATGGSTFGLNAYDMNKKVDNNGVGDILTGWDSGQNTATSGNNVWWLYEVELAEMSAAEMELRALIEEAEADYALYDGKLDTGFSSGDGVGNGLIKSTSQFSSPYTDPTEGSLDNLLDNNAGTFWHSTWQGNSVADGLHYLQVDMTDDFNGGDVVLNLIRRNTNNDHVTAMSVKDGDDVEIVPTFEIPFSGSGATDQVTITIPEGNKTLRFYEQATTSNNGYWHVGDFQLFDASYLHPDYNNSNPSVADQLTAAITAASEAISSGEVSQSDIDALQAAIDYYLDNIDPYKLDPGTVVHECVAELADWATTGNNGTHELNTWSVEADESGMVTPFCQNWIASGNVLTDATISHTQLTGLEAGSYEVTLDVRIFSEAGNDIEAGSTLSANGVSVGLVEAGTATTYNASKVVYGTYTLQCEVDENGTLDIAIDVKDATFNWIAWKNLTVSYLSTEMQTFIPVEGKMNAEVEATMNAAIAAYNSNPTAANYYAAVDAIAAAEASVAYYAPIEEVVEALDEAGTAVWQESQYAAMYDAGTLTSEDVSADLAAAVVAQTTAGSDMTYAITTAGTWIGQTGTYADGMERYGDEIAVEDGEVVKVLYQSLEGLTPGTYEVSFYAVANNAWVGAAVGDGIAQVFANDVVEDVTVYDQTGCTPTDYPHTIQCTVGEDGTLEFGLQNIATGGNWYVCQAISLTLVEAAGAEEEDLSELIAQYEAALAAATEAVEGAESRLGETPAEDEVEEVEEWKATLAEYTLDTTTATKEEMEEAIPVLEALAEAANSFTTAISGISAEEGNDVIYTISGTRVSKAVKGVYIINGKKVLVK